MATARERGALFALLAATLFGVSTPLLQRVGEGVGALSTAGLLYAGSGRSRCIVAPAGTREARLLPTDLPRLRWQ